jgi:hypothetical protein
MALEKVAGVTQCTVSRDGGPAINLNVNTTASVRAAKWMRETKMGASGRAVAKKMPQIGRIEVACLDSRAFVHEEIGDWDSVTVTLRTASGKLYALNGHQVEETTLDVIEGEFALAFEGACEEIVSG